MVGEDRVAYLLAQLEPPPESEEEIRRSLEQIMAGLVERGLVDLGSDTWRRRWRPGRPRPRLRRRWRPRRPIRPFGLPAGTRGPGLRWTLTVAVAAALLLGAVVAITPTGEAVARWVGDVLGIGEPGGRPSLDVEVRPPRDPSAEGEGRIEDARPTVLAAGRLSGYRLEIVSSKSSSGSGCWGLELPEIPFHMAACPGYPLPAGRRSRSVAAPVVDSYSDPVHTFKGGILVAGRAPSGTRALELRLPRRRNNARRRVRALLADPVAAVRRAAGVDGAAVYFAAVLPPGARGGTAVALDARGRPRAARRFRLSVDPVSGGDVVLSDQSNP